MTDMILSAVLTFVLSFGAYLLGYQRGKKAEEPMEKFDHLPPVRNPGEEAETAEWLANQRVKQSVERIESLEKQLAEARAEKLTTVEVGALVEAQAYEVTRFDPKAHNPHRPGINGFAFPICYVRDEVSAKQWATEPGCKVTLVNVWQLPDGRIAYKHKQGYRPALTIIKEK